MGAAGRGPGASLKYILRAGIFCIAITGAWIAPSGQVAAQQIPVNSVSIEGNARIGDAAILSRAGIVPGQPISAGALNAGVQNLVDSGLFESVDITPRGNGLTITVVEYPTINRINFEGNRRINDDVLAAAINSNERRVFNPAQAERDATLIAEAYSSEGRLAARVTPTIIRRSDNRVDLIFEIFEGDNIEIERLSFTGNRVFSDRRLRRVLETKQAGLFRAFVRSDTLVADRIEFDRQVLRDFYLSRGYVDFRTNSVNAELTEERDAYFLVFDVQEGQQFRMGEITVTSELPQVDGEVYRDAVDTRPGAVYSPTLIEADIARMERQAIIDGVDFLRVEPRITRDERNLTINVEYVLSRGPRVFVERIDIEGNTTTLDQVIRRQFRSVEGDPFNPREIRESAERIRALGFFSNAEVNAREGSSPDRVIVDVDVEEQPTGSLSFGASFSTNDGLGFAIQFRERNFLGRGQELGLTLSTASDDRLYRLNFFEPAFLGRDVGFGLRLDIAESTSSTVTYDTDRGIFSPSLRFPIGANSRLDVNYTYEDAEMKDRGDDSDNGPIIGREILEGSRVNSSIGYKYTYDSRTTGIDPTSGYLFEFGQDFAGIGGDNTFVRTSAKVVGERKVFNEDVTLRATLEGGALNFSGGVNRAVDRFLLNSDIIRGFESGGIGPRDLSVTDEDPLGGNLFLAARFEAEFPVGLPEEYGITGGVFYDIGNLWDLSDVNLSGGNVVGESGSFRHVIGVSVLWDTPVGPLRFNFSDAIRKEEFDREQTFEITINTTF
ncbi:outer membrane protein assembly factor BamA [Roseobacter weihaiensis]|uniref:outer membrane protein assembly factor BamA n=1 Tax=Roseobacter weihaiensis TaxID=2763262 RepID=UPI001D0BDDD8|nr:outer membrane protein assembly factor BamA [Roseobacter sp. H9]